MRKLLAALLVAVPCVTSAQPYPSKPVRVIVPFPPGGTTDLVARIVQPKFQEFMGQTVVIENRAGAGGSVGAAEVARAPADGYTLLMVFDTHAVNHHVFKMAPDPFKQLEHISLMVRSPSAFVGVTSFAPNNLREMVAYAKANPEKVTYSTPGSGSSNHLAALLLEQVAGIKMTHVAYKGGGPMIQALLGQQVHVSFFSLPLMVPHIKAGKIKPLAVGSRTRVPQLPDVQTLAETFPGFEQYSWFGILSPAGAPKEVTAKVHREMTRALRAPEVSGKLTEQGFEVVASSAEEFLKFVQAESDKLGKVIRDNKIVAE
jgi:tripartite-type tricarboxylate transporter receptor subunit TctC